MSQRRVARAAAAPARGRGGVPQAMSVKEVDPRLTAVADWLRNEKKSGLHTKEAVQYEKALPLPRKKKQKVLPLPRKKKQRQRHFYKWV